MADDTERLAERLRTKIAAALHEHDCPELSCEPTHFASEVWTRAALIFDALWALVEARCRLLEAERDTALERLEDAVVSDIVARNPGIDIDELRAYRRENGLTHAPSRGLPVPETNQEQQT